MIILIYQNGHLEIVQLLIADGADVDAQDMKMQTPLHEAATVSINHSVIM